EWKDDKREGLGTEYLPGGLIAYSGAWRNGSWINSLELDPIRFRYTKTPSDTDPNLTSAVATSQSLGHSTTLSFANSKLPNESGGRRTHLGQASFKPLHPPTRFPAFVEVRDNFLEISVEADSPVSAMRSGRVVYRSPGRQQPSSVVIDHGDGLFSAYTTFFSGLGRFLVNRGDEVKGGDVITERIYWPQERLLVQIFRTKIENGLDYFSGSTSEDSFESFVLTAPRLDPAALIYAFDLASVEVNASDDDYSVQLEHQLTPPIKLRMSKGEVRRVLVPRSNVPFKVSASVSGFFGPRPIQGGQFLADLPLTAVSVIAISAGVVTRSASVGSPEAMRSKVDSFLGLNDTVAQIPPNQQTADQLGLPKVDRVNAAQGHSNSIKEAPFISSANNAYKADAKSAEAERQRIEQAR
ncbi:MAG: M23 family metallopeptidase, partial [Betaproteobacteria bacterium]|nr:M23 family metallopeptidase [Betaproteobacteria bacterium]